MHTETLRSSPKVPPIKCHQRVGVAIDSGFQDHLIIRITKLGSPEKMCLNGLRHRKQGVQENVNLAVGQTGCDAMLLFPADAFIFYCQRDTDQQSNLVQSRCLKDGGRSTAGTSHGGHHGVRIQNQPHIVYDIISSAILSRGQQLRSQGKAKSAKMNL